MEFLLVIGLPLLVLLYCIGLFNRMVYLQQNRKNAFADIDVQLKQRYDLVPQLVESVKGYATHEKDVLDSVTQARAGVTGKSGVDRARLGAEQRLGSALVDLYSVAENYPALKADIHFRQLMDELADVENKIAAARRFFNNATSEYNTMIQQFPASMVAGCKNFKPELFYEDSSIDRATLEKAPEVKF
ncbi:MAG: hypothetical protein DI551_00240 [Micavibrio aeruginosavorus]|uniref:LemA family protein n=1 Tax=Micavibrio aeruginosavorus TaxID=349221 RepID=A0A2W5N7V3_9BACT|nr:MAG: hypothetical protein DI551_00240 [Micavibrio aeruginosavorus]